MGEIRQRGGYWQIRYYRNGKRYEESTGSTKKADAKRLLKLREGDIEKGVPVTPALSRITFDEAAAHVILNYETKGLRSVDDLRRRFTLHLTPFFGGRRLNSISVDTVTAYVASRQQAGAKHATINRELAALKRTFSLARQARRILADAIPHIEMLDESDNIRTGFFEHASFETLREALPEALRPVVTFAYLTGWRVQSEVLPLQWRQVNFAAGTITLDPGSTKNKRGREFPFAALPDLRALLETQRTLTDAHERSQDAIVPWVFHRSGRPIRSFRGAWVAACKAARCPGRIPHDFRRTAVRNLVRAGVPEAVAMQLTGHVTRSVFERYNIVDEADRKSAVARLAESLRDKTGSPAPSGQVVALR